MTADRKLSHAELRDILARHKREGQKYDDLGMCLTHILLAEEEYNELWALADKYRAQLLRTHDALYIDKPAPEHCNICRTLFPDPRQERDAG